MARDFYADGFEVAERLRDNGHPAWADRLTAVIDEGFSASEILMGLRFTLVKLLDEGPSLDTETAELVHSLRTDLDDVLR